MNSRPNPGRRSEQQPDPVLALWSVHICRFIVRDFTYDPKAIAQEKHEKSKLEMQLKKQFVSCHMVVVSPPCPLAFIHRVH